VSGIADDLRKAAPLAVSFIWDLPQGSAQRAYCSRYFAHCLTGGKRPTASGYAIGPDHAAELRVMVEERLPAEIRDLQRP
jgi:hypothetical protein